MKSKILSAVAAVCLCALCLCAFTFDPNSSVKALTHPYINTYTCTEAKLGDTDLLEKYEYFTITFLDEEQIELSFKPKEGQKHAYKCDYTFDDETNEFCAEIGILGYTYRQRTKIEKGQFTIQMNILNRPLVMKFEVK